jgi:hypothetical protein
METPKGDNEEEVADGEQEDLLEDELIRLQCRGR